MCTVSFVPTNSGFILSSNRDEKYFRKTISPSWYQESNLNLFYPKDLVSGGTWIASDGIGKSACLLNGAFNNHKKLSYYKKSRGLILLSSFEYDTIDDFITQVDLLEVEPFTLLLIDHKDKINFKELVWDGKKKSVRDLDISIPHIWSSATLYSDEYINLRKKLFNQFIISGVEANLESIKNFHLGNQIESEAHNFVMKRPGGMQTVSFSQIQISADKTYFNYFDLLENTESGFILK